MSTIKVFFTSFILFIVVFYFWKSPWSPIVDHKIQQHIVRSEIPEAVSLLEWKSEYAFDQKSKNTSLWRAAQLSFLREGDPVRSRQLLEQCLEQPFFEETTQARIYLGRLVLDQDPRKALTIWKEALQIDSRFPQASNIWVQIASEYEILEDVDQAILAWEHALQYEDVQYTAHLALGRLKIKRNPKEALDHFQAVKKDTFMEHTRAAELGKKLAQWEIEKEKE